MLTADSDCSCEDAIDVDVGVEFELSSGGFEARNNSPCTAESQAVASAREATR